MQIAEKVLANLQDSNAWPDWINGLRFIYERVCAGDDVLLDMLPRWRAAAQRSFERILVDSNGSLAYGHLTLVAAPCPHKAAIHSDGKALHLVITEWCNLPASRDADLLRNITLAAQNDASAIAWLNAKLHIPRKATSVLVLRGLLATLEAMQSLDFNSLRAAFAGALTATVLQGIAAVVDRSSLATLWSQTRYYAGMDKLMSEIGGRQSGRKLSADSADALDSIAAEGIARYRGRRKIEVRGN